MAKWSEYRPAPPLPAGFAFALPLYSLASVWGEENALVTVVALVSVFQWPFYGWLLGRAWMKHQFKQHAKILAIIHLAAASAGYLAHTHPHLLQIAVGLLLVWFAFWKQPRTHQPLK
jgi:hypothetical protein